MSPTEGGELTMDGMQAPYGVGEMKVEGNTVDGESMVVLTATGLPGLSPVHMIVRRQHASGLRDWLSAWLERTGGAP